MNQAEIAFGWFAMRDFGFYLNLMQNAEKIKYSNDQVIVGVRLWVALQNVSL
jgi:hypothetical protein